tara:strand:+ start:49 stop:300 length:252 start_codon:yes stop_codon:yes gene_type:complete
MDLNTIYSYSNTFLNNKNVIKGRVNIIKRKKKVTFNSSVAVILIANCSEISQHLKDILWYGDEDYLNFRDEVRRTTSYEILFS